MKSDVVILGAGLTGLSTAYHLEDNYTLFEKETRPGGLCGSFHENGFTFDYTGHVIHLKTDYGRSLVNDLLGDKLQAIDRDSWVYSHRTYVPYPFQVNTHGLPREVVRDCLIGFLQAQKNPDRSSPDNFEDWLSARFGSGFNHHFLFPYNRKLWQWDLKEMSAEWAERFVPVPNVEQVIEGALGIAKKDLGYNPHFLYPKNGGIEILPNALEKKCSNIHYGKEATGVDLQNRVVRFADASSTQFERLVSTVPLSNLIQICQGLPEKVRQSATHLKSVYVATVHLGIGRENLSDKHWIYFPQPDIPFYRVGFPSNFVDSVAPEGSSLLYADISVAPDKNPGDKELIDRVISALTNLGLVKESDTIPMRKVVRIPHAYAIPTWGLTGHLKVITEFLEENGIYSRGRFGEWKYSSMEDAILDGKKNAEMLG